MSGRERPKRSGRTGVWVIALGALALGMLLLAPPTRAGPTDPAAPSKPQAKAPPKKKPNRLAPLPPGPQVAWAHAPYEVGDCAVCHERNDKNDPGKLIKKDVNELCFSCHEDMEEELEDLPFPHEAAEDSCTECHNPHNAKLKKLLLTEAPELCFECHEEIEELVESSSVTHGAVDEGRSCLNCHGAHASNVQFLLLELPYNLCIKCHAKDGLKDDAGKPMPNFKEVLMENRVWHDPVAKKDCSACHKPHGSSNYRLLVEAYPEKFYAPYDPKNYALCFKCHNEQMVAEPKTTTLTKFRDGDRNLHFVHVNKADRGRTCRACHEVHAAPHEHQIRASVPYGTSSWMLKLNYVPTATGGRCEKTCHATKSYNNTKR
ncbi:MAG: cytochrome c3 family protein [Deltaproteobacteria bacterium]|nr:cytochrome c3 family protein [Deltaproteobacteria bacterium]